MFPSLLSFLLIFSSCLRCFIIFPKVFHDNKIYYAINEKVKTKSSLFRCRVTLHFIIILKSEKTHDSACMHEKNFFFCHFPVASFERSLILETTLNRKFMLNFLMTDKGFKNNLMGLVLKHEWFLKRWFRDKKKSDQYSTVISSSGLKITNTFFCVVIIDYRFSNKSGSPCKRQQSNWMKWCVEINRRRIAWACCGTRTVIVKKNICDRTSACDLSDSRGE